MWILNDKCFGAGTSVFLCEKCVELKACEMKKKCLVKIKIYLKIRAIFIYDDIWYEYNENDSCSFISSDTTIPFYMNVKKFISTFELLNW